MLTDNIISEAKRDLTNKYWGYTVEHFPEYRDYIQYKVVTQQKGWWIFKHNESEQVVDFIVPKENMVWREGNITYDEYFFGRNMGTQKHKTYYYFNEEYKLILFR